MNSTPHDTSCPGCAACTAAHGASVAYGGSGEPGAPLACAGSVTVSVTGAKRTSRVSGA
jgi:hypothetical protein